MIQEKTGYLLISEFQSEVLPYYHTVDDELGRSIQAGQMAFDKIDNLNIAYMSCKQIIGLNRTSITCPNIIS